jgi:cathepsin L
VAVLLVAVQCSLAKTRWYELDSSYTFDKYLKEFGKSYSEEEHKLRSEVFEAKLAQILQHNANPSFSWKKGVNHLTDKTDQEFSKLLGYDKKLAYSMQEKRQKREVWSKTWQTFEEGPGVDWRLSGVVSEVKDQGMCGSCWSFGTAESVESHWALSSKFLGLLSMQQILDCTNNTNDCGGTGGCGGGTPEIAYNQIIDSGGLASEWTYSYQSYHGDGFTCQVTANTPPSAVVKNYTVLPSNQYLPVMEALTNVGPLAVNVDANAWSDYESGVFSGCNQTNPDINHVVQLVGYGVDNDYGPYWIVRNSWSPAWGEVGYIRLARSSSPPCGVDLWPWEGTGCTGGPSTVTVCGECAILYDVSYPNVM